jgi:hypothetical protein
MTGVGDRTVREGRDSAADLDRRNEDGRGQGEDIEETNLFKCNDKQFSKSFYELKVQVARCIPSSLWSLALVLAQIRQGALILTLAATAFACLEELQPQLIKNTLPINTSPPERYYLLSHP